MAKSKKITGYTGSATEISLPTSVGEAGKSYTYYTQNEPIA